MKLRETAFILFLLILNCSTVAQVQLPHYPDSVFSTYYHQRVTLFNTLPKTENDIVFIGNSITDGSEWSEVFNDIQIKNRGISGDISAGIINRIDEVAIRKPSKVFLMIGINDLARGIAADSVVKNILLIVSYLQQQTIGTKVYVQSILPVNDLLRRFANPNNKIEQIKYLNGALQNFANEYHYTFINLYPAFCDNNGKLNILFTNDGLHLKGAGYMLWKHLVYKYVYGLQDKPSLLPKPQALQWSDKSFHLYACKSIFIKDNTLQKEAQLLQHNLQQKGLLVKIVNSSPVDESNMIELKIDRVLVPINIGEAYHLKVTENKIIINANTNHGIFNAIQTLQQLMRDGSLIDNCEITDWPAFAWRGYMVDVGRNYQSIKQLKQQIDVMAAYKLNIFHFHLTEDIAWRLQSIQYPQLTQSKNMLRNPGEYYTIDEMKELIDYCKNKYITLILEIDMPGHSDAFKRAMGVDMQSKEGLSICKTILAELCTNFNVPYIHIGGDEVKITNEEFLPQMIALIKSYGKKVLAWSPGGDVTAGTILQMWNGESKPMPGLKNRFHNNKLNIHWQVVQHIL